MFFMWNQICIILPVKMYCVTFFTFVIKLAKVKWLRWISIYVGHLLLPNVYGLNFRKSICREWNWHVFLMVVHERCFTQQTVDWNWIIPGAWLCSLSSICQKIVLEITEVTGTWQLSFLPNTFMSVKIGLSLVALKLDGLFAQITLLRFNWSFLFLFTICFFTEFDNSGSHTATQPTMNDGVCPVFFL